MVRFELRISAVDLHLTALVTDQSLRRIELLLGQPALRLPGVTLVARRGKAEITKEEDVASVFRNLQISCDPPRRQLVLGEGICCKLGATISILAILEDGSLNESVYCEPLLFEDGHTMAAIPAAVLKSGNRLTLTNLGRRALRWKQGKL